MNERTPIRSLAGAAAIAALLLVGCEPSHDASDPPVARAFEERLYRSDLRAMIPVGTQPEDSAAMAQGLIQNWLRERVVMAKAEENLGQVEKDFQKQLDDYRRSLLIYTYEKALIGEKLDAPVSDAEVERYYNANLKNFVLRDNIVRVRWFKLPVLPANARNDQKRARREVQDWFKGRTPEDRHELEVWLARNGIELHDTGEEWMPFSDLRARVPIETDNPTDLLANNQVYIADDTSGVYHVEFLEHRAQNSTSPLDMVRSDIIAVLIDQRKVQLQERMRQDLFNDALEHKNIETY